MSMYVKPGSASIYVQSLLNDSTTNYQKSMERLSSGYRYTTVGENPINVCKTAKVSVQISANAQALSNIKTGGDLLTLAEEVEGSVTDNLMRIKDLCLQVANGTYSAKDKDGIIAEIRSRLGAIDGLANSTKFNDIPLLDGSATNLQLQAGPNSASRIVVGDALIDMRVATFAGGAGIALNPAVDGSNWTNAQIATYGNSIDSAIDSIIVSQAKIGGYRNRLEAKGDTLTSMGENLTENKSIISDTDTAQETADMVRYQIMQNVSVSMLTQVNQAPKWALNLLQR